MNLGSVSLIRDVCLFLVAGMSLAVAFPSAAPLSAAADSPPAARTCKPTEPDALGPFYKPDAPVRSLVGTGYVLSGVVRSSADCSPVKEARIEFWLAGPEGQYGDEYRATMLSDKSGAYRFESHYPPPYYGRPSHIHIRVSAKGCQTLVTQHYPLKGKTEATFDLVLVPLEK